jgi:predicted Na+-dependent transporter
LEKWIVHGINEPEQPISGWAAGGVTFAATLALLAGTFQVLQGLVAIFNDDFYVVTRNYTFDLDTSAWGWIHLLIGLLMLGIGFGLFREALWAVMGGIAIAILSALSNFFFIPYYPIWALLLIALDVWIIWSLTRAGVIKT